MKNRIKIGASIVCAAFLIGCGSGGDSGGASDGGESVAFPSNAVLAAPTIDNGEEVREVVAADQTTSIPTLNSVSSSSSINLALLTQKVSTVVSKNLKDFNLNTYSLNETVNETEQCSGGGSINFNGTGSDSTGGTVTITYSQCVEYGSTTNGIIKATIANYDSNSGEFKDTSISFLSDYTMNIDNYGSTSILKGSNVTMNILAFGDYGSASKMKYSITMIAETNSIKYGQKDSEYYIETSSSETQMYQTKGRIYIGSTLESYVDYDTSYDMSVTPFVFSSSGITDGEARYIMSSGAKLKVFPTYVEIDSNSDGTYELSSAR